MKVTRKELYAIIAGFVAVIIALVWFGFGMAAEKTFVCWTLCQPGGQVNLRMEPTKESKSVGWLECGDSFETDGESRNGWFRVLNRGECECWIYCGSVVTQEPEPIGENYVCVAKNRVACRRWVDGPQIEDNGRPRWLVNGSNVSVFYIAEGWAVTSRGYIMTEWLEVDPE